MDIGARLGGEASTDTASTASVLLGRHGAGRVAAVGSGGGGDGSDVGGGGAGGVTGGGDGDGDGGSGDSGGCDGGGSGGDNDEVADGNDDGDRGDGNDGCDNDADGNDGRDNDDAERDDGGGGGGGNDDGDRDRGDGNDGCDNDADGNDDAERGDVGGDVGVGGGEAGLRVGFGAGISSGESSSASSRADCSRASFVAWRAASPWRRASANSALTRSFSSRRRCCSARAAAERASQSIESNDTNEPESGASKEKQGRGTCRLPPVGATPPSLNPHTPVSSPTAGSAPPVTDTLRPGHAARGPCGGRRLGLTTRPSPVRCGSGRRGG
ncbi:hypothetical protein Dsi01nite_010140 [Dactylosporangium siamense]|uniref:Uncharacterized protein n=1 Tax=Dactylosporangium siamense TaxID=685454 RepID=A0A919U9U0_9ACTN|nr:hypothetical protein Dsi01nite_010140 [Dactylosporangium siamense]